MVRVALDSTTTKLNFEENHVGDARLSEVKSKISRKEAGSDSKFNFIATDVEVATNLVKHATTTIAAATNFVDVKVFKLNLVTESIN